MTSRDKTWMRRVRKTRAAKRAQSPDGAESGARAIVLPETLDLAAARPLAEEFLARRGAPVVVDALGIQRPGAACLQVLLAAAAAWERDGVPFGFINCGPLLIEHVRFLGLDPAPFQLDPAPLQKGVHE